MFHHLSHDDGIEYLRSFIDRLIPLLPIWSNIHSFIDAVELLQYISKWQPTAPISTVRSAAVK
jgi:hypothetical protein